MENWMDKFYTVKTNFPVYLAKIGICIFFWISSNNSVHPASGYQLIDWCLHPNPTLWELRLIRPLFPVRPLVASGYLPDIRPKHVSPHLCMYIYMWRDWGRWLRLCVFTGMCAMVAHTCAHTGQGIILVIILRNTIHFFWDQVSQWDQGLTNSARLSDQWVPGIFLSVSPGLGLQIHDCLPSFPHGC